MATAIDGCQPAPRTVQTGTFNLPLPADEAFELFTAEGERRWVEGWNPAVLSDCGGNMPGAVFLTDHGRERTIWTVIEAHRDEGHLVYSRVSPGRRAGTVRVTVQPRDHGSEIAVTYDLTVLGPEGQQAVRMMDKCGFAAMLEEWRRLIMASIG